MNDNSWRLQAKHATVCPRCRAYINIGSWIVKEDGYKRWSHAVCPVDLRRRPVLVEVTDEEFAAARKEIKFNTDGSITLVPVQMHQPIGGEK